MKKGLIVILQIQLLLISGFCQVVDMNAQEYLEARKEMVERQISARGIADKRVLEAMGRVERHQFVPEQYRSFAYSDRPLPIGEGQTISQPYVVAFMTEILELKKNEKVLEIGTGSGYQAAVLAEICDNVWTIEVNDILAERARRALDETGYSSVNLRSGDGFLGWEEHSPFNAIIVTCAPSNVPRPLQDQLAEGGRMIIPVDAGFAQELILLKKIEGKLVRREVLPVRFVPMLNKEGVKY